jgi:hypothetical protein
MNAPGIHSLSAAAVANSIDTILVPQGAEFQAVGWGLSRGNFSPPRVLAVPIGCQPLAAYLETWLQSQDFLDQPATGILLLGLAGSLSPQYRSGDVTIYHSCSDASGNQYHPSQRLTALLQDVLGEKASLVKGFTSDRLIISATDKAILARHYQADVVDMESTAALAILKQTGIPLAIARTISDDYQQDLPDLTAAISPTGSLKPLPLAIAMLQRPAAAVQLIQGSRRGLKALANLTSQF